MDIKCAKISNQDKNKLNPKTAEGVFKGQRGVCCLSCGVNAPKDDPQAAAEKVTEIIVESYMRRPALSVEAADGIFARANDRVLLAQSPEFPSCVSSSAVFILKNKFMYASAGNNVIFHYVDGVLKEVFTGSNSNDPEYLGNPRFASPKTSEQFTMGKGENTFLICSAKFASSVSEEIIEETLKRSTHVSQKGNAKNTEVKCDRWLKALYDQIPNKKPADDYSAVALSVPAKKKSTKKLVIGIIIAVVLLVAAFLAVGFFTRGRGPQPPQEGEPGMTQPLNAPGMNQERPTGPNGEVAPDPPTRPPQN